MRRGAGGHCRPCGNGFSQHGLRVGDGAEAWPEVGRGLATIEADLARLGFRVLPLGLAHALAAGALDWPHRDPIDRMLAAQAVAEGPCW